MISEAHTPAAVATASPRRRTLAIAHPAVAWLTGLVVISTLVRFALTWLIPVPWIFADELKYSELAKSFAATGSFAIRDVPGLGLSPLYPLLISPAYALFDSVPHAYLAIRFINSLLMSLAAVPTYLLARRLVTRGWALTAAALTLLVPSLGYAGMVMTESLFLPLFLTTVLVVVAMLERPTVGRQLAALGLVGLALLTRPAAVALVPALLSAIATVVAGDRVAEGKRVRQRLAEFLPTFAALGAAVVALAAWEAAHGRTLIALFGETQIVWRHHYSVTAVARWLLYHTAELDLYSGVLPFAALLVLGTCVFVRGDQTLRVFAAVAVSMTAWLLLVAATFVSGVGSLDAHSTARISDRYTFYALPLLIVALAAYAAGRLPTRARVTVAAAAVAGALPLALPFTSLIRNDIIPDSFGLLMWSRIDGKFLVAVPHVVARVAFICMVLAALFVLLRKPRLARLLPLLVALYLVAGISAVVGRTHGTSAFADQSIQSTHNWVDRALGSGQDAVVIWSGRSDPHMVWENEFFNRSVGAVYYLRGPSWAGLPEQKLVLRKGELVDETGAPLRARYALVDPWVILHGRVVARDRTSGVRLYRLAGGSARIAAQ